MMILLIDDIINDYFFQNETFKGALENGIPEISRKFYAKHLSRGHI